MAVIAALGALCAAVFGAGALACAPATSARAPPSSQTPRAEAPVVAAYLPDYRLAGFRAEQANGLTDLVLFSVRPDRDGHVRDPGGVLSWLAARAPRASPPPFRTLVSVGGGARHRSEAFAKVTAEPELRRRFVGELVELVARYGLDGLDLDWEPVDGLEAREHLAQLLVELERALPERVLLTVAVTHSSTLLPEAVAAVDRVHLMAYDGPAHGSLKLAAREVEAALAQGIPPRKLFLGVPLYALGPSDAASWRELVDRFHPEPDTDAIGGLRFNGVQTVRAKARLVVDQRLGGIFFWELTQDASGDASLIALVREALTQKPGKVTPWSRSGGR